MKNFLKKHGFNICMILVCLIGVCIVAYPTVSDLWNRRVQSQVVRRYTEAVSNATEKELQEAKLAATLYNASIYSIQTRGIEGEDEIAEYEKILNLDGSDVMGYIVIPAIDITLPIYHGTDEKVLQSGVGHSQYSSVPIGGNNTHSILLGHRGLPSARLFTDLDQLMEGDYFEIHVLDEILYYKIYDIEIVEPVEMNKLRIEEGKDYVTLVTCTPYGVNTHRLLIKGTRTEEPKQAQFIYSDARKINDFYVALAIGAVFWMIAMIILVIVSSNQKKHNISRKEKMRRDSILHKYDKN